jgi:glycyl-tRNA synthetase (class II)
VRHRDTMEQDRVPVAGLERYIRDSIKAWKPAD